MICALVAFAVYSRMHPATLPRLSLVACSAADRAMTELERLAFLEQQAEEAYDAMYEAHSFARRGLL